MLLALRLALGLLTRIPVQPGAGSDRDLGRSLFWFPFVGSLLGVTLSLVLGTAALLVGPNVAAALTLAAWLWLTGGLHADGLADSIDGLSASHADRERGLDVMRDPNIGAHGALALVTSSIIKYALLTELARLSARDGVASIAALTSSLLFARFWVAQMMVSFPAARKSGMGARFRTAASRGLAHSGALWLGLGVAALAWFNSELSLVSLAVGLVVGAIVGSLAWKWSKHFGGLTGDLYGALVEFGELAGLLCWQVQAWREQASPWPSWWYSV
ncbi:MAG TPA: adenosylcobinamide-GDP ribazoletransferase [Polyangiaceae bacterium]|jgi:adenosylcobinamide-GDP ribazoletransferase|nr:adenosylcobinamide-GDP ribazoletransferase [Polyangiaceae bacterium]